MQLCRAACRVGEAASLGSGENESLSHSNHSDQSCDLHPLSTCRSFPTYATADGPIIRAAPSGRGEKTQSEFSAGWGPSFPPPHGNNGARHVETTIFPRCYAVVTTVNVVGNGSWFGRLCK
jgi:hypothetical protein